MFQPETGAPLTRDFVPVQDLPPYAERGRVALNFAELHGVFAHAYDLSNATAGHL